MLQVQERVVEVEVEEVEEEEAVEEWEECLPEECQLLNHQVTISFIRFIYPPNKILVSVNAKIFMCIDILFLNMHSTFFLFISLCI